MINTLWGNLSKIQKIGIIALIQVVIIIGLVLLVNSFVVEKQHAHFEGESNGEMASGRIPDHAKDYIGESIWQIVKSSVPGVGSNIIDDIVIRDGTYEEIDNGDNTVSVSFIVDIDSLRQTYVIKTGWAKNGSVVYEVVVDCPPVDQMKYPETVCKSMYTTTASPELYLPHYITSDEAEGGLIEAYITNDLGTNTINVDMSPCKLEETRKKVDDYLNSTGIILDEYQINYYISSSDVDCEYKTTLMEEYYDGEE